MKFPIKKIEKVVECLVLENMQRPSFTFGRIRKLAKAYEEYELNSDAKEATDATNNKGQTVFNGIIEGLRELLKKTEAIADSTVEESEKDKIGLAYYFIEKCIIEIKEI